MSSRAAAEPPVRTSRRTVIAVAALGVVAPVAAAGCDDSPRGPARTTPGPDGSTRTDPGLDPAVVAALRTVSGQVRDLAGRYSAVVARHPGLRAHLASARAARAAHLARLDATAGPSPTPGTTSRPPAVPATVPAALADLAAREQRLSVMHQTAATRLSGEPARLLASIAAAAAQFAVTVNRKPAGR